MLELALHVLDVVENSLRAGARSVTVEFRESVETDRLSIEISDDGCGMSEALLARALDPFCTTKTVRRVGLGLPLLAEAARISGGRFSIESREGAGTRVTAEFGLSHIDRQPLGDLPGVWTALVAANAGVEFRFGYRCGENRFAVDTREIRQAIGELPIGHAEVLGWLRGYIRQGLDAAGSRA